MKIIKISQSSPDPSVVSEIAGLLKNGSVIAYPTDTFYGLGADVTNQRAIERLYSIKNRMHDKPILILISDIKMLQSMIADGKLSPVAGRLTDAFWPGPLTLVFRASDSVSPVLTGSTGKIGIRLPDNKLCKLIIDQLEHPITATSANISGEVSTDNPDDVLKSLGDRVDAIVDGGKTIGISASSVVDISGEEPIVLREGAVHYSAIKKIIQQAI